MKKITKFDKQCLNLAINIVKKSFKYSNYPVGAVLAITEKYINK